MSAEAKPKKNSSFHTPAEELAIATVEMLALQELFRKSRRPEDHRVALASERKVKALAKRILHPKQDQPRLFDGDAP